MTSMTRIVAVSALALVTGVDATGVGLVARTPDQPRTVVVAELFNSEGCSSCPPADDLLRSLVGRQPIDGVEVIALGNHVDYWDPLGWRDPFSAAVFSQRQSSYEAAVFRSNRVYTPQLVVDGTFECTGSDAAAVTRTILKGARQPKAAVSVFATPGNGGTVRVEVHMQIPTTVQRRGVADVVVAVTEDGLVSRVQRGENGGATLSHSAVVRALTTAGSVRANEDTASAVTVQHVASDWNAANLRIVGFVQERGSRRILGGGATSLKSRSFIR
jgi:hypothetical protein